MWSFGRIHKKVFLSKVNYTLTNRCIDYTVNIFEQVLGGCRGLSLGI